MLNKLEITDDVLQYLLRAVKSQTVQGEEGARSMLLVLDLLKKAVKVPPAGAIPVESGTHEKTALEALEALQVGFVQENKSNPKKK
jgi:hypothetical protein